MQHFVALFSTAFTVKAGGRVQSPARLSPFGGKKNKPKKEGTIKNGS